MSLPRIGVDARHAARGLGLSTFVGNLSQALAARGEFDIVWLGSPGAAPDGLEVHPVRGPYPRLDLFDAPGIARRHGLDAMFFGGNSGPMRPIGVPVVLTVHDLLFFSGPRPTKLRPLVGHFYERQNVPRAIRASTRLASGSQSAAQELRELVPGVEVAVIHHGVRSSAGEGTALAEGAVVAFAGRDQRKRTDLVLDAYRRLAEPRPKLVLLASAGIPDALRDEVTALEASGAALVLGHTPRPDVDATIAASLALVYPSEGEGFGLPVIEGMVVGAPVITGLAPSTREIGAPAALMIDPADPAASIAAAIEGLRADPISLAATRVAGLAHASTFTWAAAAKRYADLFHDVLDGPR